MEFTTDVLSVFDKKWALLTAGDKDKFNTMTISWGGLGTLWNTYAFYVLYANIDNFDATKHELDYDKLSVMDK